MSSTEKTPKKYGQWSEDDMKKALEAYKAKKYGLNETCRIYSVPKATFKRHLDSKNKVANKGVKSFGRITVFSRELEDRLATHILNLEKMFFGVTIKDVRKAAFVLADTNNIKHNFNKDKGLAGKKWFYSFMRRHPTLSLRQPESTSIARCKGFNRENVNNFFDILEKTVDENQLTALRIFNMDESGFSTVAKKCQKILALKGKRQVGTIATGERGVNTTFVVCASAAGQYVAPMLIFKRKRANPDLGVGAPPDCLVEISDTGYINTNLFVTWLKTFIKAVKPTVDNKVLLVLDGHSTHSKNLEAIELARNNGVIMLQLPGHTTHRLQPLDVAVFKPLELYYTEANEKWLRCHPGLTVSQYQVAQLLGDAYARAAVMANAMSGFRKSGIWPVDRNVFSDADFAPADVLTTNQSLNRRENESNSDSNSDSDDEPLAHYFKANETTKPETEESASEPNESTSRPKTDASTSKPSTSKPKAAASTLKASTSKLEAEALSTSSFKVKASTSSCEAAENMSIEEILLSPVAKKTNKKYRGAQKAQLITASPYKDELEAKQASLDKKKNVSRKVQLDSPSIPKKKKINENEWYCKFCKECIIEDMIQCLKCRDWIHESCANVASTETFICDFCV